MAKLTYRESSWPGLLLYCLRLMTPPFFFTATDSQGQIKDAQTAPPALHHVKVYAEPGRFGGWSANHGAWLWGNEILVGFSRGYYKDLGERQNIDPEKPEEHLLARSLDGGETWTIENPAEQGALIPTGKALHGITPPGLKEKP